MPKQPTDPAREARAAEATKTGFPPPETIVTSDHRVMCDGGGGPLGHPRVYYEIGDEGYVECGYCDRRFVLKGGPADTGA
ncbi:zinc-finger domain-containing protein [Marinicauda salina]|uniref:Zinc-finger domain-containing protein n=1 Tax=Marinicauda salina TaxID=2135793 RepID=A0A2U2BY44_9PROT|nr:zinc-finger domain-containing protein [Marinicauda salina]PWE18931.1 zinc-finger domain-containing protein [Marinicauda salina]